MNNAFSETLKKLRAKKGFSQTQLAEQMFVNQSTVARWENGSRLPDASMITRLSALLDVDVGTLLAAVSVSEESPNILMVDDSKVILSDSLSVLEQVLPSAAIKGFIWPQQAIEYAKTNRVALAFLDIELGTASGLDLCSTLLEINPRTNVVFLTAYPDYSLDAWNTGACGFMVKPLTPEGVRAQLKKLRYPIMGGDSV
ncbi:MAG: response regulator [Clostridia bacterium]|nr:response regulator [Clostridia bacterium]